MSKSRKRPGLKFGGSSRSTKVVRVDTHRALRTTVKVELQKIKREQDLEVLSQLRQFSKAKKVFPDGLTSHWRPLSASRHLRK